MWPTCGSTRRTATLDPWGKQRDQPGCYRRTLHSHNIPAVLLTGVSGTLRTLFCHRLNKRIRLIVAVCNRDWEMTRPSSMWVFQLSFLCMCVCMFVCVYGLISTSRMSPNAAQLHKLINTEWHINPASKCFCRSLFSPGELKSHQQLKFHRRLKSCSTEQVSERARSRVTGFTRTQMLLKVSTV